MKPSVRPHERQRVFSKYSVLPQLQVKLRIADKHRVWSVH